MPYLPLNLETLANDVGKVVENFRQVASRVALNGNRGHEELHVEQRHPLGQRVQGILQGSPKFC